MRHRDFVERVWVKIRMEKGVRRIHTATKLPVSKEQTKHLVRAIFEELARVLASGQTVSIPGFGKFSVKRHAAGTMVYHPKTRERIPRRCDRMKSVRFKSSATLLDNVNGVKAATER